MDTANELVSIIRDLVKEEIESKDHTEFCTIQSVNSDGTLNVTLLSDINTIIPNIYNCSSYTFGAGDTAILYKMGNKLSNSFVIAKPTAETPNRIQNYDWQQIYTYIGKTPLVHKEDLLDILYPVGAIYITTKSTSPASWLGGTWTRIKDKFLLARGETYDADGGSATHTHSSGTLGAAMTRRNNTLVFIDDYSVGINYTPTSIITATSGAYAEQNPTGSHIQVNGTTGSASSLPPYKAVYIWERIA